MSNTVLKVLSDARSSLSSAECRVADLILEKPDLIFTNNISDLAEMSMVSDATVIRLCKRLGYTGFYQMKIILTRELGRSQLLGEEHHGEKIVSFESYVQNLARNILEMENNISEEKHSACVDKIYNCETLHLSAEGNTLPLAVDFAFKAMRLGIRTSSSVCSERFQFSAIAMGSKKDVLLAISHTGSSSTVLKSVDLARQHGIYTIGITDIEKCPLSKKVDLHLATKADLLRVYSGGTESHSFLLAVLESIVNMISNKKPNFESDEVEYILSDTKI